MDSHQCSPERDAVLRYGRFMLTCVLTHHCDDAVRSRSQTKRRQGSKKPVETTSFATIWMCSKTLMEPLLLGCNPISCPGMISSHHSPMLTCAPILMTLLHSKSAAEEKADYTKAMETYRANKAARTGDADDAAKSAAAASVSAAVEEDEDSKAAKVDADTDDDDDADADDDADDDDDDEAACLAMEQEAAAVSSTAEEEEDDEEEQGDDNFVSSLLLDHNVHSRQHFLWDALAPGGGRREGSEGSHQRFLSAVGTLLIICSYVSKQK